MILSTLLEVSCYPRDLSHPIIDMGYPCYELWGPGEGNLRRLRLAILGVSTTYRIHSQPTRTTYLKTNHGSRSSIRSIRDAASADSSWEDVPSPRAVVNNVGATQTLLTIAPFQEMLEQQDLAHDEA